MGILRIVHINLHEDLLGMAKLILTPLGKTSFDHESLKRVSNCLPGGSQKRSIKNLGESRGGEIELELTDKSRENTAKRLLENVSDDFSIRYGKKKD